MTSCVHFIFNRGQGGSGQSLTDTSMNGTWIDKMRVGKGNKAPLSHGNIISVLDQGMEVFCYLDKVTMEMDFHPSLTSKYLVGKVLGEGTKERKASLVANYQIIKRIKLFDFF